MKGRHRDRQLCGTPLAACESSYPPRRRPWIGRVNGTFSPGKEKASDLERLHICKCCHTALHNSDLIVSGEDWNRIAFGNLIEYALTIDPSRNLAAEVLEWVQERMIEMEGA